MFYSLRVPAGFDAINREGMRTWKLEWVLMEPVDTEHIEPTLNFCRIFLASRNNYSIPSNINPALLKKAEGPLLRYLIWGYDGVAMQVAWFVEKGTYPILSRSQEIILFHFGVVQCRCTFLSGLSAHK